MTYRIKRRTEHTSNVWRGKTIYQTKQVPEEILLEMDKEILGLYIHSIEKF